MGLYIHIPPCPPEGVAVSEDEEGAVGTCPERGGKGQSCQISSRVCRNHLNLADTVFSGV